MTTVALRDGEVFLSCSTSYFSIPQYKLQELDISKKPSGVLKEGPRHYKQMEPKFIFHGANL
jgi:hypothetical protein